LFKTIPFPASRNVFDFIKSLHFVSSVLSQGPSSLTCLPKTKDQAPNENIDDVLSTLFLVKFRKQALAKVLQTGCPFLVLECLKLIRATLGRFEVLKCDGLRRFKWSHEFMSRLSASFAQRVPDLQIILTIQNCFEAFPLSKDCILVNDCLHRVLESFVVVLPSVIKEIKFDWLKLIPAKPRLFFESFPLIQRSALRVLRLILGVCEPATVAQHRLGFSYICKIGCTEFRRDSKKGCLEMLATFSSYRKRVRGYFRNKCSST
jgi:hypothetical protein